MTRIYQKGATVKMINQLGCEINGQLRRDIATARPSSIDLQTVGSSGRLCLGNVSYLYNLPAAFGSGDAITAGGNDIYFVRVVDGNNEWCERSGPAFTKYAQFWSRW